MGGFGRSGRPADDQRVTRPTHSEADSAPPPGAKPVASDRFVRHARTFAALTLVSRVLGLVRDALLVRALGVSAVCTAFNIAFQAPNTFRRLFGEGALSAAFIPEYAQLTKRDPSLAARFASLNIGLLSLGLGALVILIEVGLGATLMLADLPEQGRHALVFLAIMLPYMPLVCVTAILGGMLQTHGRFAAQAGAPIILNACMIGAAWGWGYAMDAEQASTALAVSGAVTCAGFLQVLWCLWDLRKIACWTRIVTGAGESTRRMLRRMGPVVIGLGTVQIGTLIESWLLVGWPLYFGSTILGWAYPLDGSSGAALYNAQRLYQFPLGVFGIALATAVFPLLARQSDEPRAFAATLRRGLRLALFIGLPATAGLLFVAEDLTATVYMGREVSAADARRMADVLIMYAAMVGAYSVTHVLTRAFYALGDTKLPTRISIFTVIFGLLLSAVLMWPLGERGLALASSIAAVCQLALLAGAGHRRLSVAEGAGPLFDRATLRGFAGVALCTGIMLAALWAGDLLWRQQGPDDWTGHAIRLAIWSAVGAGVYSIASLFISRQEIHWLLDRPASNRRSKPPEGDPR